MLKHSTLDLLRGKKNLLAFSAGVDSTALAFLLQDKNIQFDIAIVNYNTREQSIQEVAYAQNLAQQFSFTCHTFNAEKLTTNFEAQAREIRYQFFEKLIEDNQYDNLLTAHHLGDRLEWMMMQFCKGAGCVELAGMYENEERQNYTLIRPLLHLDKPELLTYLNTNNITYFEDETNNDKNILRNSFRHDYTKPLLEKYLSGIKKSFEYIDEDRNTLVVDIQLHSIEDLVYFQSSFNVRADIIALDKHLKQQGYLMSANERSQVANQSSSILGRKYLISKINNFIFVTPYKQVSIVMEKVFKEKCRLLKIDPKIRPYFYLNKKIFTQVEELLSSH